MLIIAGRAGAMLGKPVGGIWATSQLWIVVIGVGTLLWALHTGKAIWKIFQTVAVIALLLLVSGMTWLGSRNSARFRRAPIPQACRL